MTQLEIAEEMIKHWTPLELAKEVLRLRAVHDNIQDIASKALAQCDAIKNDLTKK